MMSFMTLLVYNRKFYPNTMKGEFSIYINFIKYMFEIKKVIPLGKLPKKSMRWMIDLIFQNGSPRVYVNNS